MSRARTAPAPLAAPPAPSFTLSTGPARSVSITVTVAAGTTRLWVWRVSPSGTLEYVRGAVDLTVTPGTLILYDYEAPLGVELTYYAQAGNDAGELSAAPSDTITLTALGCDDTWLTNVAMPANTFEVDIEQLDQLAYAVPTGVHKVIGRRAPIVASDIAQTPSFDVSLLTETDAQRLQATATLGDGVPCLLRTPPANGIGNLYFSVLGWQEQRIVRPATVQDRRFSVQGQEVERPDPKLYVPVTLIASYQTVKDENTDYAMVKATHLTYEALAVTYGDPAGGTVVPWPAHDA